MSGFGPRPGASGGDVIGAPSPSDGKGANPTSLPPALAGTGVRAGSGAGGGGGAGLRTSGPDVERFPNTLFSAPYDCLRLSFSSSGVRMLERERLNSVRPLRVCASERNVPAARGPADTSD